MFDFGARARIPILIGDGCNDLTATRNEDGTYRVTTIVKLEQNGEETEATVEIERALIHIEALDNGKDIFRIVIPQDEIISENFPEPSQEDWELLGINSPKEE